MAQLNPYLNFDKNCREAMTFYHDCLGGELKIQTVAEMPEMAAKMPPEMKDQILHSSLTSGDIIIMGSDLNREKAVEGNTVQLCLSLKSEEELVDLFSRLSKGGKVTEPISDMPWGAKYGSLTDRYNKQWVFNYQITDPM